MKNHYLFLLLFSFVFIAACEDDDGNNDPVLPIQVRIFNNTDQALAETNFRFDWQDVDPGFQEYGPLDGGVTTEYKGFEAGGSCSLNFQGVLADSNETVNLGSLCLCVCELSEGFYTLQLEYFEQDSIPFFAVSLEED